MHAYTIASTTRSLSFTPPPLVIPTPFCIPTPLLPRVILTWSKPNMGGEGTSPSMCVTTVEAAMANPRREGGTDCIDTMLAGPCKGEGGKGGS